MASSLFWAGCSSSHGPDPEPIDPEWLEAERERVRAERQAELAEEAERAELERAVQAIESEGGEPPRPLEEAEVSQLFLYYCGECHGTEVEAYEGMYGIENLARMIERGKITPGDGDGSRLVVRMRMNEGRMPPLLADLPPMPEPSIERIAAFIDALPVPENAQ
jgi:hypothetical protein